MRKATAFFLLCTLASPMMTHAQDWAAHANDPVGMYTDMLAFDRACGAALDFARRDGQTAVVIVPDHGNSGISIGKLHSICQPH